LGPVFIHTEIFAYNVLCIVAFKNIFNLILLRIIAVFSVLNDDEDGIVLLHAVER